MICVTILAALAMTGCGGEESAKAAAGGGAAEAVAVQTVPLQAVTVPRTVDVSGTVEADARTTIASDVSGRVVEVLADLGDRLGPGEPLARIDPTDYQLAIGTRRAALDEALADLGLVDLPGDEFDPAGVATVRRSRLQRDNAAAKLGRAESLYRADPPLISEQEYADLQTFADVAKQDYDVALLQTRSLLAAARTRSRELEIAQTNLERATIRTPAAAETVRPREPAGTRPSTRLTTMPSTRAGPPSYAVARRYVTVGQLVGQGDQVFDLVVDDPLRFTAAAPERFVRDVRVGQTVALSLAGRDAPVEGTVARIDPTVDAASRTFLVEVLVDNADRSLRPGSFARGKIEVGRDEAFRVPAAALVSFAGTDKVFGVADGKAVERRVSVLTRDDESVTLTGDGLAAGEAVVTTGGNRLADGIAVSAGG